MDRFTVSLDTELLAAFDAHLARRGYENRSEAIRDLIRDLLVAPRLADRNTPAIAVITVVCDHEEATAYERMRSVLLEHGDVVLGSLCRTLEAHHDLFAIMVKGSAAQVERISDRLRAIRGVGFCHVATIPNDAVPAQPPL